jgi:hypothetical protein
MGNLELDMHNTREITIEKVNKLGMSYCRSMFVKDDKGHIMELTFFGPTEKSLEIVEVLEE